MREATKVVLVLFVFLMTTVGAVYLIAQDIRYYQLNNPRCPHCMSYVNEHSQTCSKCRKDFSQQLSRRRRRMKALTDKILLWLGRTYERIAPIVAQAASAVKKTAKYSWIRACQVWVATLANSDAPVYKPPVYHPLPGREPTFRERAIFNFVIGGSCLAYLIAVIVVIRG